MTSHRQFLEKVYDNFNKGEFEQIIAAMDADVKWANGLEGGFVFGRDAVREYWTEQFKHLHVELEPLSFQTDAVGRDVVTVRQIVKDREGELLADATIHQIFTVANGTIIRYEIEESETIHDRIRQ